MSEWKEYKLGQLTTWKSGGTPSKTIDSFWGGDISWVSAKSFKTCRIYDSEITITEEGLRNGSRLANINSLLLLVRGSGLFNSIPVGIVKKSVAFNQDIKSIEADLEKVNPEFLLYWFLAKRIDLSNKLEHTGIGAGKFDIDILKEMEVSLPGLSTQTAIAEILSSLDDKIELNNKINKNLEDIAQVLFKQWFVDFDFPNENGHPYKSSGGEMVDSELGEIPKGWTVGALKDVLEVKYGKDHKHLEEGEIPCYGSGGIMRYVNQSLYDKVSILIPRKGTLGNLFYINKPFWSVDTIFYTIIKKDYYSKYIFYFLKQLDLAAMDVGSAVPSMTTKVLNELPIIIPIDDILNEFDKILISIFNQLDANIEENQNLANLRDTLLPKLISGELSVNEAVKEIAL